MLNRITSTIQGVVDFAWPMVIISIVIIVSLRVTYLLKNHEKIILYKELLALSFIIYILCLFQVVTFQDNVSWSTNNFIPFKEMFRYEFGSRLFIKNIVGNVLLFLPYGYFAADYLKSKKMLLPCFLTFIVSLTIELVQLNIGRTFDVDDVILNTIGGILGYLLYRIIEKIKNKLPRFFKSEGFMNFFVILILILFIVYLCDLHMIEWLNY